MLPQGSYCNLVEDGKVGVLPEPAPGDGANDGELLVVHRQGWSVRLQYTDRQIMKIYTQKVKFCEEIAKFCSNLSISFCFGI